MDADADGNSMISVDTGVLALALNRWAKEHARAASRLEALVNGDAPWAVTWPALHELVERVVHRHSVARPLTPADAAGFIDQLFRSPSLVALGPTPRHADVMREVLVGLGAGSLPAGFDSAVILREHGVRELLTTDAGMRRFTFLMVIDPFAGEGGRPATRPGRRYRKLSLRAPRER